MKKLRFLTNGFTVIEFLVFVLIIGIIAVVALTNIRTLRAENRDFTSKTDINELYFQLESFHERNGHYPETITEETLPNVNPDNLTDTNDRAINTDDSKYTYRPFNCAEQKCKRFELSAELEKEAPFIKESLNQQ